MGRVFPESHLEKMRSLPQAHNSVRNVLPGCQSHPVPLRWAHHCYSQWLLGLRFSGATNTSDLHLCCPQRNLSSQVSRVRGHFGGTESCPASRGKFCPKGSMHHRVSGSRRGDAGRVQQTRDTTHAGLLPHIDCCGLHRTHRKICEQQGLHSALEKPLHFMGMNLPIQLHIQSDCSEP